MTLIKKMALGVLVLLFVVFLGTYFITLNNARNFFIQQMESNAQDTATSLGLSLSQSLINRDEPAINSMVQAVFDRGYFSSIVVKDLKGKIIVKKLQQQQQSTAPSWFLSLIQWTSTEKSSLVVDGWMQVGVVSVSSNPGFAYSSLWLNAVGMVKAYLLFGLIALILVYAFLQYILKPLKRVTAQAQAISANEFPIEHNIPKTPELKQVTLAMNQMVLKVKALFQDQLKQTEALRAQVYQDPLTGLSNRRYFLQQISSILDNEDEFTPGYIIMIDIDGLDELNQHEGYQKGDELILTVAQLCKEYWSMPTVHTIARMNGSTFALINTERDPIIFERECKEFLAILKQNINHFDSCTAHVGASSYVVHQSVTNLLTMTDLSIKEARETGYFYCKKEQSSANPINPFNGDDIKEALDDNALILFAQAVTNGRQYLHKEIFVRMCDSKGIEAGADYFMPIAEKNGLAHLIDLYVLREFSEKKEGSRERFALNISDDTLLHKNHQEKFLQQAKKLPVSVLNNLSVEINESVVLSNFKEVSLFVKQAKKIGLKIGVDRVGIHFSPLHYLSDLHIDYLKLHGSLVQDLNENESKQFFIHYFNEMAKTMDIEVIATQIEQETQWKALQGIHIPWGQGRYLAEVELLK